ncbi:MAG: cob(I)yrinic acid a,c-diamide adenosyltransferase [Candidatus Marinimicrobia bacterium]|nr:cob(I)yrinic acid a,c-diamide adenosyltransferase [Candidatus Neomarinimicrobiota bacterium]MCF7829917.1 cob(I)yrinic acid a,c-diamide adenosyltransferase [Candidatus Neomarinimicrobiota bacterium]MCF7879120.1 cob(I)yrinic acid a,c-diamide adenosyltransferase [Candidatus Neomarinimicrobiota bacterium]
MKIYTRRGDGGKTSLFSGERVPKTDELIEAYGTVDELNSSLGVVRSYLSDPLDEFDSELQAIQNILHVICANLANTSEKKKPEITPEHIESLEARCDYYEAQLPDLKKFILPGGSIIASNLHMSRSICRRAERRTVAADDEYEVNPAVIKYLNRLSDLLFLMARYANHAGDYPEQHPDYD